MEPWTITETIVLVLLYLVGVIIQAKITYVCWKEKDSKTWLIHMIYSMSTIIYFGFYLPLFIVTTEIPNLAATYTGEWFCYLATFITVYGVTIITFNSLLVALVKYTFIVHHDRTIRKGEQKVQKIFCIINLSIPLFLALFASLTRDFDSYGALNSCFGTTNMIKVKYNDWSMSFAKFFLCDLSNEASYSYGNLFFILKQTLCVIKSVIVFVINTNLPEAFLYYKIFKKMKW